MGSDFVESNCSIVSALAIACLTVFCETRAQGHIDLDILLRNTEHGDEGEDGNKIAYAVVMRSWLDCDCDVNQSF